MDITNTNGHVTNLDTFSNESPFSGRIGEGQSPLGAPMGGHAGPSVRCLICLHPGGSCLRKFRQQIISTEQFMQKIAQLQTQQVPLTARETSCFLESIGKRWLHLFHDCCGHPGAYTRTLVYFKLYFHMCMYTYMCMIMYVCIYNYIYVYIYMYIYICVCVYVYFFHSGWSIFVV